MSILCWFSRLRMDRRLRDAGHLVGTLAYERAMQQAFIAESSATYPDVHPDEAAQILNEIKES